MAFLLLHNYTDFIKYYFYKYIFKFYFKYFITLFIFYQLKIITPFPFWERGYYKNGLIYKIEASFTSSISFFSA